jgi:cytochrome c5
MTLDFEFCRDSLSIATDCVQVEGQVEISMIRKTVTTLILMLAAGSALAAEQVTDERLQQGWIVFNRTCSVCHWPGIGGAPAIGNKAAWKDRIEGGTDLLYRHAIKGWNGNSGRRMPARGGNWNLTDEQVRAAVDYIIHYSR